MRSRPWLLPALLLVLPSALGATCGRTSTRNTTPVQAAPPPATPPPPEAMRFAVIGDFGSDGEAEAKVAALVKGWNPAHVLTTGDNNYPIGVGLTIEANIGKHYGEFIGGQRGRPASENRFWPTPGNHDWYNPLGLSAYKDYFALPGNERYYDVVLGKVHLFMVDSDAREPDGNTPGSVQHRWLQQRMAASTACWKFVVFHHPPFSSGPHGNADNMNWPFKAWGADAVFNGHDHTYERIERDGLLYFVDGLGGASRYDFRETAVPGSVVRYNAEYGAMLVTVGDDGVDFEFRDVTDRVIDHVRLEKPCAAAT